MRDELKLENDLPVSLFQLYVSQNRKITSMAVKKERLITDVITCVFLNKTFLFSTSELKLCCLDGILSSCMAQLWVNCLEMKLLGNTYHQNDVADIGITR